MGFKILFSNQESNVLESYSLNIGNYQILLRGSLKQELCVDLTENKRRECILYDGEITIRQGEEEFLFRIRTYRINSFSEGKLNLENFVKKLLEDKKEKLEREINNIIMHVKKESKKGKNNNTSLETCIGRLYKRESSLLVYEV